MAALSLAACAGQPFSGSQTPYQFEASPLGFTQNPRLATKVDHRVISNEAELMSAAERIKAEHLGTVVTEDSESISARSIVSPL